MEVRIYRSAAELAEAEQFWITTQRHPNTDLDHFLLVCRSRPEVIGPWIIGLWDDNRCRCLVVGRLERTTIQPTVGYARLPRMAATIITIVHAGIVGKLDEAGALDVATALDGVLRKAQADVAVVNLLAEGEPLWLALKERARGGCQQPRWSIHRKLSLEPEPGFLVRRMRSKHRSWINRKEKELEAAFPGMVGWEWHSQIADVAGLCEQMEMVARTTYQRGLGAGFVDDKETRERLALFAGRGQLRAFLMKVNEVPKAFWLGELYGGVFHSSATGYAPDVGEFEVGTLMFLRMVDELSRERVGCLDFGLGDAHYKERFGDRSWREATVRIFAPTIKGRLLHAVVHTCEFLDRGARTLVERIGSVDQIKKRWRRSLAEKATREQLTRRSNSIDLEP